MARANRGYARPWGVELELNLGQADNREENAPPPPSDTVVDNAEVFVGEGNL